MTDYLEQAKTNRANDNLKASTNAALIAIAEALQCHLCEEVGAVREERDELREVVQGADHTAAKYWRRAQIAERDRDLAESRMHAAEKRATEAESRNDHADDE